MGGRITGGSLQSPPLFLVCMPAGRLGESAVLYLSSRSFNFPKQEAGDRVLGGPIKSAAAVLVYMTASREGKRADFDFCALQPFEFSGAAAEK